MNSAWMCDYGRLNFHYVNYPDRLKNPQIRENQGLVNTTWNNALVKAGEALKRFQKNEIAVVASARMTNEELWLTKKLIDSIGTPFHDVVPRTGKADEILMSADRNPNTLGAQLIGITGEKPGSGLKQIADRIRSGALKAVVALGENLTELGLTAGRVEEIGSLDRRRYPAKRNDSERNRPASFFRVLRETWLDDQYQGPFAAFEPCDATARNSAR